MVAQFHLNILKKCSFISKELISNMLCEIIACIKSSYIFLLKFATVLDNISVVKYSYFSCKCNKPNSLRRLMLPGMRTIGETMRANSWHSRKRMILLWIKNRVILIYFKYLHIRLILSMFEAILFI